MREDGAPRVAVVVVFEEEYSIEHYAWPWRGKSGLCIPCGGKVLLDPKESKQRKKRLSGLGSKKVELFNAVLWSSMLVGGERAAKECRRVSGRRGRKGSRGRLDGDEESCERGEVERETGEG